MGHAKLVARRFYGERKWTEWSENVPKDWSYWLFTVEQSGELFIAAPPEFDRDDARNSCFHYARYTGLIDGGVPYSRDDSAFDTAGAYSKKQYKQQLKYVYE